MLCAGAGYSGIAVPPQFDAPDALLIRATDGDYYLVDENAGASGQGAILRLDGNRTVTTLHEFRGDDGAFPNAALVQMPDGGFLGTTSRGGAYDLGTVFRLGADGAWLGSHAFSGDDGAYPAGGLELDADGT